jgi:hypothetical protein
MSVASVAVHPTAPSNVKLQAIEYVIEAGFVASTVI